MTWRPRPHRGLARSRSGARAAVVAALVGVMGCASDGATQESAPPDGSLPTAEDEAASLRDAPLQSLIAPRMTAEDTAREVEETAAVEVADNEEGVEEPTPVQPVDIPVSRDRDPEEEKRKMSLSRERSAKAVAQLRMGNLDRAIREARQALKIHEQNVEAMLVISEAFFKQGKYEIAQSVAGLALQIDPKVLRPNEASQAYNLRGFAYLAEGNATASMNMFRSAADGDEQNAAAWNNVGVQFMGKGDYGTAIGCFEYAVELDPAFTSARLNLGAAQRGLGKLVEAEQTFESVIARDDQNADAHFNLGVLYLDAEPFPGIETTERLNRAVKSFTAYKERVLARAPQGQGSVDSWTQALEDAPGREFVSVEQAELYIGVAKKGLEREERRRKRDEKRKKREADEARRAAEEAALVPEESANEEPPAATQEEPPMEDEGATAGAAETEDAAGEDAAGEDAAPQAPAPQAPAPQAPAPQEPDAQAPDAQAPDAQEPDGPAPQAPTPQEPAPQAPAPQAPQQPGSGGSGGST